MSFQGNQVWNSHAALEPQEVSKEGEEVSHLGGGPGGCQVGNAG